MEDVFHAARRYSDKDLQGEAAPHFKISRLSEVCCPLNSMCQSLDARAHDHARAGSACIILGGNHVRPTFGYEPHVHSTMSQVRNVLEAHFELQPPRRAGVTVAATPGEPAEQLAAAAKGQ